jgi:hypothetical protein
MVVVNDRLASSEAIGPSSQKQGRQCGGVVRGEGRCRARALAGSPFCLVHDASIKEREALRKRGAG